MKTVPAIALVTVVDSLLKKHNLPQDVQKVILKKVNKLQEVYGSEIPYHEIVKFLTSHLKIVKDGLVREIVDIEEFVESPEYLGIGSTLYPKVKQYLIDIYRYNDHKYEIVIGGGIGGGKTTLALIGMLYDLYRLSCMASPQLSLNLMPNTEILFVIQSVKEDKARVEYERFRNYVKDSKYFSTQFRPIKDTKKELVFPKNIVVKPVTTKVSAIISENLYEALLDECNFITSIGDSKLAVDNDDPTYQLYNTMITRMESRFKNYKEDTLYGKIFLVSSANYEDDFIDQKRKEAESNKGGHIYYCSLSQLDKPNINPSGKKIWIKLPSLNDSGEIFYEKPENEENVIEIPYELKNPFEKNLLLAVRDILGIPLPRKAVFLSHLDIEVAVNKYKEYYGNEQIFKEDSIVFDNFYSFKKVINLNFLKKMVIFDHFAVHVDFGLNNDSLGIAIGHINGSRTLFDEEEESIIRQPIIVICGAISLKPPKGEEIDIGEFQKCLAYLKKLLPKIKWITLDNRPYTAGLLQFLKKAKIRSGILSVDVNIEPYFEVKNLLRDKRLWIADNKVLLEELKRLRYIAHENKIDHPKHGSKDIADCVAGVVYTFIQKKIIPDNSPVKINDEEAIRKVYEDRESGIQRPSLTNRPWRNRK